ncbi:MAG: hypothetical protein OQJ87_10720, partial [Rhodospirillales bacterium]|nr:hypothetical protein [Rhodospirillales bacterium]
MPEFFPKRMTGAAIALTLFALAFSPPALAQSGSDEDAKILTEEIPEIAGPKRTVAIGRFDAIGAFTAKYGNWDIGGGLAAMLTSALVESERFIVVERAQLQQILTEQELKGQKVTTETTGPDLGQLVGVQFMIIGSVTEFGGEDKGGGFSLGASGGNIGNLLSGALSRQSASGNVAMDFRVVDTTSGRVLETHRVSEPIESSGFDLSLGYQGVSLGTNQFYNTPLGGAARKAITRAVQAIAANAQATAWTGQVVDFDNGEVYINAGSSSGIKEGDTFMVERIVKKLTDPATSEVLMIRKKPLGLVEVQSVTPKIAFGAFQPL